MSLSGIKQPLAEQLCALFAEHGGFEDASALRQQIVDLRQTHGISGLPNLKTCETLALDLMLEGCITKNGGSMWELTSEGEAQLMALSKA